MKNKLEIDDICLRTKMKCLGLYKIKSLLKDQAVTTPIQDFNNTTLVPLKELKFVSKLKINKKHQPNLENLIEKRNEELNKL